VLKSPDGTGNEKLLVDARDASFSPDGKFVIYTVAPSGYSSSDIWYRSLEEGSQPVQYVVSEAIELSPEFSPDGKFVAYVSNETGREEVFVRPFPDDGRKWQVSKQSGSVPRWSKRGDELFFNSANKIVSVTVSMSPKIEFVAPKELFEYQPLNLERISGSFESFDISPDGKRFVLLQQAPNQGSGLTLTFVQNWYAEFKGK
jgi:serine/threonine-protein kinase